MIGPIGRWWICGTLCLAMVLTASVGAAADAGPAPAAGSAGAKECLPKGLYLYETEEAGYAGCGVLVDSRTLWQGVRAGAPHLQQEAGAGNLSRVVVADDPIAPGESANSTTVGTDRRLLVDQTAQLMRVYENGAEMRTVAVSTGMLTSRTFTRAWQGIVGREMGAVSVDGGMLVEHAWYLFPDVFGNILIHSVPYVQQGSVRTYDQPEALGVRPSSHGCIRISVEDALWLREWNPVGVPIEIMAPPGPIQAG